ncbi:MAG: AbrB/MazE/SpoVT family DNA-binding domain-containing protein [Nanoarchaeota archaeon]
MATLTQKSQVTIPKTVRGVLGISPGDEIEFVIKNKVIRLQKKKKLDAIEKYRGILGHGRTIEIMGDLR